MYKALVRSHLDYCDIIYHIPSVQTQLGVTLTDLMEKAEKIQYHLQVIDSYIYVFFAISCLEKWLTWHFILKQSSASALHAVRGGVKTDFLPTRRFSPLRIYPPPPPPP